MPHKEPPPVLRAEGLTKKYGRRTALSEVDLTVPAGRVIGLVGPNGAGKSTLLHLACGLIEPTSGSLRVLGSAPAAGPSHLARVGFVAQDTPVYGSFTVADHLRMGAKLNPGWDRALAERRVAQAGLNPAQRAGGLSGGRRAQLALTIAAAIASVGVVMVAFIGRAASTDESGNEPDSAPDPEPVELAADLR